VTTEGASGPEYNENLNGLADLESARPFFVARSPEDPDGLVVGSLT
jgi:hypothetical protein